MSHRQGRHTLLKLRQLRQTLRLQRQGLRIPQLRELHILLTPRRELLLSQTQSRRRREHHIPPQGEHHRHRQLRIQSQPLQELRRHRQPHQRPPLAQRNRPRPPAFPSCLPSPSFPWSSCSHSLRGRHGGRHDQRGEQLGARQRGHGLRVHARPLPPEQ